MSPRMKEAPAQRGGSPEQLKPFIPTPERVSQYLELKYEEVKEQMKTFEGRRELRKQLMVHAEDIKKDHTGFRPELLESQLDTAGEMLLANERYVKDIKSPEKKGLFRRTWERVKGFAKKHPVATTVGVLALAAGGVYLALNWEMIVASAGLQKIFGQLKNWGGAAKDALGGVADKVTDGAKGMADKVMDKLPTNVPDVSPTPTPPMPEVLPTPDEAREIFKQLE